MISVQLQEWQQMKAKISKLQQQVNYLRNQNQLLKKQLNINQSNSVSQASDHLSIAEKVKNIYSKPDAINFSNSSNTNSKQSKQSQVSINNQTKKYLSLDFIRNQSILAKYPQQKSLNQSNFSEQRSPKKFKQDPNSITVSRKSYKQIQLQNLILSQKSSQKQNIDQLHLIQQICVFGPTLDQQVLSNITFKNDQKQTSEPSLYYPKQSEQYKHYGNYLFPKKCRTKPTQKSNIPIEGNKIIFKSSKKPDCNIFIFQGNQKQHPIKQRHQMLENVNPSKWLYGIVIEFNDFVFKQFNDKKQQSKKSLQQQPNQLLSPPVNRRKRSSLLEIDIKSVLQEQIRMQSVSLKDIQLQQQKLKMYRSTFCLCIFTYFPFVTYLQSIITSIFDEVKLKRIQHFPQSGQFKDCDIFYFIKQVDLIAKKIKNYFAQRSVKLGKQLSLNINQTQLHIDLSKQYLYKQLYCTWSLKVIKMMDRQIFYQIYSMIMLQQSVTFVCQDKKILTSVILLFASMMTKPFIYPYPVVSVIFSDQLLQTPFTSIVGINQPQTWLNQAIQNRIIDFQNKQIVIITQKQVKLRKSGNFNSPKSQRLRRIFTKFYKKLQPSSFPSILLRKQSLPLNETIKQAGEYVVNFVAKLQIFYHQNIFAYIPNNIKMQKKSQQKEQQNKVSTRNQLLNEIEKQYKRLNPNYLKDQFIKEFVETQIFSIYLMNQYQLDS